MVQKATHQRTGTVKHLPVVRTHADIGTTAGTVAGTVEETRAGTETAAGTVVETGIVVSIGEDSAAAGHESAGTHIARTEMIKNVRGIDGDRLGWVMMGCGVVWGWL